MGMKIRLSKIYVWLHPDTDVPVYVGKTSQTVASRMRSHRQIAMRKPRTKSSLWLSDLISDGKFPKVIVLDEVSIEMSSRVEARWFARFARRYEMLNQAPVGAGNPGVGRVNWTPEIDARLGKVADSVISEELGCNRKTVSYRRQCLGIDASFDRTRSVPPPNNGGWNKLALPKEAISSLGNEPDYVIGKRYGCCKTVIRRARLEAGIDSYAKQTGNNGRIKRGDPHRRWK